MNTTFTQDWFSNNISNFQTVLRYCKPKRILEVGCFEGRATCWMLQNMLPADGSITCIDTFEGGVEHTHLDMSSTQGLFMHNVACVQTKDQQVTMKLSNSFEGLLDLYSDNETFDFIYIDGSHETPDVLEDSVIAYKLLPLGGVMLWDDYGGGAGVKPAVDAFLRVYKHTLEVVVSNYQIGIRRVK